MKAIISNEFVSIVNDPILLLNTVSVFTMTTGSSEHVSICILPENDRTREIRDVFAALHEKEPEFYIRVPGRYCMRALKKYIFL